MKKHTMDTSIKSSAFGHTLACLSAYVTHAIY